MLAKESCIVNDKVVITVKSHQSYKLNLVTTSEHHLVVENMKTAPVNICYNNVELQVMTIERYTELIEQIKTTENKNKKNF